jgi:catechol 2,3-dioxygenase
MAGERHLGHVHLKVRDLDRAVAFYRDVLELAVTERHGGFAFLSYGDHHHDLALQAVGAGATNPGPGVGLYHSAWEVPDEAGLHRTYERLREREVAVSPIDHGISLALYFDDPAGNGVEAYLDTRAARDMEAWNGRNEPFDPADL